MSPLVVHEAAHWAALRAYGREIDGVSLGTGPRLLRVGAVSVHMFPLAGGITLSSVFSGLPWRERFVTALAGPLASAGFASALLAGALTVTPIQQEDALFKIGLLSLFLCVFNLLPLPCLDGFEALRALAEGAGVKTRHWKCRECSSKWMAALLLIAVPSFWFCMEAWLPS